MIMFHTYLNNDVMPDVIWHDAS